MKLIKKLKSINEETSKENFWKNQKKVKNTLKEKKFYEELTTSYRNFVKDIKNLKDLHSLGNEEKNDEIVNDCVLKLNELYKEIKNV